MSDTFQTGKTFVTGEQVTATDLNNAVNQATPKVALTDDQSITVVSNKLTVKDGSSTNGVPLTKMKHIAARSVICNTGSSTAAPTALAIADNQVLKGGASGLEVGTIDNDNLTNNGISIDADSGTTHEIDLGETLTVTGGEGIDTTISDNTLTVAGEDASSSNKGLAKFNTDNFSVSSGDVTIKDGGVNNDELAGSIANSKLSNSSLTVTAGTGLSGGGSIALGGSATLNVGSLTNSELSGSAGISNANLANSAVTVTAGTGLNGGGSVALGASATINLDSAIPNNSTTNTQSVSDNSTKIATTAYVDTQVAEPGTPNNRLRIKMPPSDFKRDSYIEIGGGFIDTDSTKGNYYQASYDIPNGYKITQVTITGSDIDFTIFECEINTSAATSKGTGSSNSGVETTTTLASAITATDSNYVVLGIGDGGGSATYYGGYLTLVKV